MPSELPDNAALPHGTVTFLFTDIEGSTRLWESQPEPMRAALADHDNLLRDIVAAANGVVFKTVGDAICAVFASPPDAVAAAVTAQRALRTAQWPTNPPIRVRMAVHTGAVESRDRDYFGSPINRLARVLAVGHGGQTLVTQVTCDLCRDALPAGVSLRDLGSHRLKDLARPEHVYQLDHPDLNGEFPPLNSLSTHPNNLPEQLTSFIGRAKEIAAIEALFEKTRLLTLTGPGGSGKTRLALQVAGDLLERFPDGVWLVELAPLTDPGLVAQTVSMALDAKESHGEAIVQTLVARLSDKRLLLVLDNSEHVLDSCASLADTLVRQCPRLSILATSREPLGITGEQAYQVPPLSLPDRNLEQTPRSLVEYESVQLFVDRARLVRADFDLTDESVPALASLCRRLDGIPLAIELAAARVRSLSVPEIEARLDQRFRLLTGGSRAALPRQQTLRALVDWSYNLLTEPERQLLQALSVFGGGWTLAAAEAIYTDEAGSGGDVFDLQSSLCDKSLVVAEQKDGESRYRSLETVREYAVDRLLESGRIEILRARHRDYFLALAEATEPKLRGAEQADWLRRLEAENENLRAALDWSLTDAGSGKGLRFCAALQRFWWTRGYLTEGRDWIARLLEKSGDDTATPELARAINAGGVLAQQQGDFATAWALHEQTYRMRERVGDRLAMASSLNNLGTVKYSQCDFVAARGFYERSIAFSRELDDRRGLAGSLYNLGIVALDEEKVDEARALVEEAYALARELGDRVYIANDLLFLATVAVKQRDFAAARRWHGESLSIRRELGDRRGVAYSFEGLAALAARSGNPLAAASMWGAAERLRAEIGAPIPPTDEPDYEALVHGACIAAADNAAFDRAWQAGHDMDLADAIEFAEREIIGIIGS